MAKKPPTKHLAAPRTLTMPADWWMMFEGAALSDGLTLSEWIGAAAKAKLTPDKAARLSERVRAGRPKLAPAKNS